MIHTAFSFHEEYPPQLVKLQDAHWKPLIEWVSKTFDVEVQIYEGILGTKQSAATIKKLGEVADAYDQYKLAGTLLCPFSRSRLRA